MNDVSGFWVFKFFVFKSYEISCLPAYQIKSAVTNLMFSYISCHMIFNFHSKGYENVLMISNMKILLCNTFSELKGAIFSVYVTYVNKKLSNEINNNFTL